MLLNIQDMGISAMLVGEKTLAIHLKTELSKPFHQFLNDKDVPCSKPSTSTFNVIVDKRGHEHPVPSVCSMTAVGTFEDFQKWVKEFYPTEKK